MTQHINPIQLLIKITSHHVLLIIFQGNEIINIFIAAGCEFLAKESQ